MNQVNLRQNVEKETTILIGVYVLIVQTTQMMIFDSNIDKYDVYFMFHYLMLFLISETNHE